MQICKNGNRAAVLQAIVEMAHTRNVMLVKQGMPELPLFVENVPVHSRDIDFWTTAGCRSSVRSILHHFRGYLISECRSEAWLSHDVYLIPCSDGLLQVDVTVGDLMVGPVTLISEHQMVESITESNRLSGLPLIADLVLRPSARGRCVGDDRLLLATSEWARMGAQGRAAARKSLAGTLGRGLADTAVGVLNGEGRQSTLARALRRQALLQAMMGWHRLRITMKKVWLHAVGVISRRNKPFGRFHRGLLLAISGTDGAGKSSVVAGLEAELSRHSVKTTTVYLGRSRGNLPGIDSVRNFVGARVRKEGTAADLYRYSSLDKLVSWYYAFEYIVRVVRPFVNAKGFGKIVLCDRYVYDIQLMPGFSAVAAKFASTICPIPDINVLLSASPEVIRRRKQERSIEVIHDQQMKLGAAIAKSCGTSSVVRIDTGTTTLAETCQKIARHVHQVSHPDFP